MTFKKLVEEKLSDGRIQLIVIMLMTAISIVFAYWRTSESGNIEFLKAQLKKCEADLRQCDGDRVTDIERCNRRLDTMLLKLIDVKIELEQLKAGI